MALAPEWMSYKQEMSSSSQGSRSILGKERERGSPKYGKQRSYNNLSYLPPSAQSSYALDLSPTTVPFACSVTSPPAPPHAPPSILGDPSSRVLNRSKSSPGFGSPKSSKQKKSPDRSFERAFPSFKQSKPKAPKPSFNPSSYGKSHSQPNLLNNEKAANWQQQKLQSSSSTSSCAQPSPLANSSTVASPPLPPAAVSPTPSPPLPAPTTVTSPPLTVVPEIDKLKQLIPTAAMPPKSVRVRGVVGPPLPLAKKPPAQPGSPSQANSLAAYFRKATSEPSLMHHKGQQGQGQGQPPKKRGEGLLKEAVDAKLEKRSNFFQNIIKQEELGVAVEDDSPIGNDYSVAAESITPTSSPPPTTPPPESSSSPPLGLRSPLPEDMEDEERFMRTLGWVPEDEDPVPVLAEEEIADVRVKIFLSKSKNVLEQDGVPLGIDVDVQ